MVFQIPKANVKNYVKNAPPNIVFSCCLLTIGISVLFYGLYIKSNEFIVNEDAINNWKSVLKYMNGEKLCIKNIDSSLQQRVTENDEFDYVTINYGAVFEIDQGFETISNVEGFIPFNDFNSICPNEFKAPKRLHVSFNIGSNISSSQSSKKRSLQVCVMIKGPASFLPKFLRAPCMSSINHQQKWGTIINTQKMDVLNTSFCADGHIGVPQFHVDHNSAKLFDEYLTVYDKNIIVIRLMWFGSITTFIGLLTFLYGVFFTND